MDPLVVVGSSVERLANKLACALVVTGLVGALAGCLVGCKDSAVPARAPTLAELQAGDQVKQSGKWLMSLPMGLHRLDAPAEPHAVAVIGVHGYESAGYEWVYPLKTLGQGKAQVYFYRWSWESCPDAAAARLREALDGLLRERPELERVQVFAHSYGGVIAALMAAGYPGQGEQKAALEVNLIASPLAGHTGFATRCSVAGVAAPAAGAPVTLRQWRTRQHLDGAFKELDTDPQVVELPGEVTRLPEVYEHQGRSHRLGHNWSISWVADQVSAAARAP